MRKVDPAQYRAKRRHIMTAAAPLFAAHGLDGTSTARIREAAGVSSGTLFHYFPSKRAVFVALLTDDDNGTTLFDIPNMVPGRPASDCIAVTYEGDVLPVDVHLDASADGALVEALLVTIEGGTGGSFQNCGGFEPDGTLFEGTLQELADVVIKRLKGSRYFKRSRDEFWASEGAKVVRGAIVKELGAEITSVDAAFDYCLSRIGDRFPKRDSFIATSDLCRSFVVLCGFGIAPVVTVAVNTTESGWMMVLFTATGLGLLGVTALLSWTRMMRFRDLSDVTVFRVYLASKDEIGSK